MSRQFLILPFLLLAAFVGNAAPTSAAKDSSTLIITLDNPGFQSTPIDSVYVIFDRYDLRGAGVVRQVYYPKKNIIHVVIPKGKYYMNLFCLGIYSHECFDRIITAKANRKHSLTFRLQASSLYTPGFVTIPEEKIDLARLAVLKYAALK